MYPTPNRAHFARHILAGSFLLASTLSVSAGTAVISETKVEKKEAPPLLSFFDGRIVFDLEERLRFEARSDNRDFDNSINDPNDDSWLLSRFRLGLAIKPTSWLKIYGQLHDTREWDSDRINVPGVNGTEGGDTFDLRQAYVELGNPKQIPLSLTVGRQILNYGDARLVADPNWGNLGRTFDGVKVRYYDKGLGYVDLWAARPVQLREDQINDSDSADNFFGIYSGLEFLPFQTTELYALYRDKRDNQPDLDPTNKIDPRGAWTGPAQRLVTLGTRWKSNPTLKPWDYTAEFAWQFGDLWTGDRTTRRLEQRAFATALVAGYTFNNVTWTPRLGVEYDYASGDGNPTDGKSTSFQNLFASNHVHYGFMDEFDWRNLHDARLSLTVLPVKKVAVSLDYHAFWLADTHDYWARSNNGNNPLRTRTPDGRDVRTLGANSFAGQELDFLVKWKPTGWLNVDVGYSHFFAGDYLRDTGPADDADFGYVQAQLLF